MTLSQITHLVNPRVGNPGGQDERCHPVTIDIVKFETGLRQYQGATTNTKPWKKFFRDNYKTAAAGNKLQIQIKPKKFTDKFEGRHNKNMNAIRHILADKNELSAKMWSTHLR